MRKSTGLRVLRYLLVLCLITTLFGFSNPYVQQYERKKEMHTKLYKDLRNEILSERFKTSHKASITQTTGFILPAEGTYTSDFGHRTVEGGSSNHLGMDIANITGTPVKASQSGVVVYAGYMGGYGNVIILQHTIESKTYATVYAHLSKIYVTSAMIVSQGDYIGGIGSTGNSTGPHLHFEIHTGEWNGSRSNAVDPYPYIKGQVGLK